MFKNLKKKFKRNLKNKRNPILRNLAVVIVTILVLLALGFVATMGKVVVNWVMALGTKTLITIAATAVVSAILFGIVDSFFSKSGKDE